MVSKWVTYELRLFIFAAKWVTYESRLFILASKWVSYEPRLIILATLIKEYYIGGDQVNDVSSYVEQNRITQNKASKSIQIGIETIHFGDKMSNIWTKTIQFGDKMSNIESKSII